MKFVSKSVLLVATMALLNGSVIAQEQPTPTLIEEGFQIENSLPEGTKAKPEIWEDYETFQSKAQALTDLATSFTEAGTMSDFDPRQFGSKTCGSCHRDFKLGCRETQSPTNIPRQRRLAKRAKLRCYLLASQIY